MLRRKKKVGECVCRVYRKEIDIFPSVKQKVILLLFVEDATYKQIYEVVVDIYKDEGMQLKEGTDLENIRDTGDFSGLHLPTKENNASVIVLFNGKNVKTALVHELVHCGLYHFIEHSSEYIDDKNETIPYFIDGLYETFSKNIDEFQQEQAKNVV